MDLLKKLIENLAKRMKEIAANRSIPEASVIREPVGEAIKTERNLEDDDENAENRLHFRKAETYNKFTYHYAHCLFINLF